MKPVTQDKTHIVSFSGGRTSAYLVHLMEQKRKKENINVEYVFMDTGAEHPKTYEFIKQCVEHFGIKLTCLTAEVNPELGIGVIPKEINIQSIGWNLEMFSGLVKKHGAPYNPGGGFCTDMLKTVIFNKYVKKNYGKNYTSWIGIRVDETRRLKAKPNVKYLAELSMMDKDDIIGWWAEMPFNLDISEWLGNCVFCIKKGVNKVALAIKQEPDLAAEWSAMINGSKQHQDSQVPNNAIYRGKFSIEGISNLYSSHSEEDIIESLRKSKMHGSGCGSESCEVFGDQMDMFKEVAA